MCPKALQHGLDEKYMSCKPVDAYQQLQIDLATESLSPVQTDILLSLLQCQRAMQDVESRGLMAGKLKMYEEMVEAAKAERLSYQIAREEMEKRIVAERKADEARRESEKKTADYLYAAGKLHMRGLLEYAESQLLKDEELKHMIQREEKSVDHNIISKGTKEIQKKVSRWQRWMMALDMERYSSLFLMIKQKIDDIDTTKCAGEAIAKLHNDLNSSIHRTLTEEVLDPSNPAGTHVIIIAISVGDSKAHLLECIAHHFEIPCQVYK